MTALNTMPIFCICDTIYASAYSDKEYRSPPLSKHLPTDCMAYIISHEACTIPFEIASISTVIRYVKCGCQNIPQQKNLKNTTYIDTCV